MRSANPARAMRLAVALLLCLLAPPRGAQAQSSCSDNNPCTDDILDPVQGCVHADNTALCNDGNACTTNDVCNGGTCVGGAPAAGCTACQAASTIPADGGTFAGATSGASTLAGTCGTSGTSGERVYRWTPTASGTATIQTCGTGTNYDTVVYLRSATCTGSQVTCNDDAPCAISGSASLGSRIAPVVTAGQTYFIVVDGYNGRSGSYSLTVTPPHLCGNNVREGTEECDGTDRSGCVSGQCSTLCACVPPASGLADLVPEISDLSLAFGSTVASGDVAEGCAERTSGVDLLRFSVRSRNVGTADLRLGNPGCPSPCNEYPLAVCTNPSFMCSPAGGHNHAHYANFARYELLNASSQAVVVGHKQGFCLLDSSCANPRYTCTNQGISAGCSDVYSASLGCQYLDITGVPSGSYTLRVTLDPFGLISELNEVNNVASVPVTIGPAVNACSNRTAIPAAGGTFTGTTSGSGMLSGSCGDGGPAPERVFQWTPAVSGIATIQTCGTGTNFDTVLYLRGGSCTGAQVACNDDACAIAGSTTNGSRISPTVTAGQTYFIVVDGFGAGSGAFSLTVTPPSSSGGACPNATTIPAAGGAVTGVTAGTSTLAGTCGSSGNSPEQVFRWTPARSGTATIQTCGTGTNYDTVVYMRATSCSGAQVACNDDACTIASGAIRASRITPTVTAGQTYMIVVDGYNGQSGTFRLSVTPP